MTSAADTGGAPALGKTDWSQLALVCFSSFVVWSGFGAILPYLPVFLKEQAHAPMWMIGLIASMYYAGTFTALSPLGRLSDRIGRKPVVVSGMFIYALSTFLFVTTTNAWWFLLFRLLEGVGAASVGPAGSAFVADISDEGMRGRAYGLLDERPVRRSRRRPRPGHPAEHARRWWKGTASTPSSSRAAP